MKLVHAADLHLDSPLTGLERYAGAPADRIRQATRRAFEALVQMCLDESVDGLLLAGDLYDGDWKDYSTGLFFSAQMSRLRQAAIPVVWIRGNHDAASVITKHLKLPDNVRELPVDRASSVIFEQAGFAVHGQGFAARAVSDDLSRNYPERLSGLFNVGLLHTSVNGRPQHDPYAPCSLEALVNKGYEYWALGHVHRREVLSREPWVVFPGNLQGRHLRETGAKGATLVTVDANQVLSAEHRSLDVVRWEDVAVDISEAADADDAVDLCRLALERELGAVDGRLLAARLVLRGRTRAHAALCRDPERFTENLRSMATDLADDAVWVTQVQNRAADVLDWRSLRNRPDAVGQLVDALCRAAEDEALHAEMREELAALRAQLPAEFQDTATNFGLGDAEAFIEAIDGIAHTLLPDLLQEAEE